MLTQFLLLGCKNRERGGIQVSSLPASSPFIEGENFLWVFLESKMFPALSFFPTWELITIFRVSFIGGVHETILHPAPL